MVAVQDKRINEIIILLLQLFYIPQPPLPLLYESPVQSLRAYLELSWIWKVRSVCVLSGIDEGAEMIKSYWFFAACCILALILTAPASASVWSTDGAVTVSLKYNNGEPSPSESFMRMITGKPAAGEMVELAPPPPPTEQDLINVLTITDSRGDTYTKNIQTAPVSEVYVTSTTREDTNVMQTTNEPGYSVLEIYWGYDQSNEVPWVHYMRVNNVEGGYAVYSDFQTKGIWTKPISVTDVNAIINSGAIPDWESVI